MPIRINLLAEAQAAEESRRRDPLKFAILAGVVVVCGVLLWSSTIQVKIFSARSEMSGLQSSWRSMEKNYQTAIDTRYRAMEAEEKVLALQRLTTNRFLWGTALNALQQTLTGIDDVQLVRFKAEQGYTLHEEIKAHTEEGKNIPGRPAGAAEKISITLEGFDSSAQPGGHINKFKTAIANEPFFQSCLNKTNGVTLLSFSPPQADASGRSSVRFSLQCLFPEKVREK